MEKEGPLLQDKLPDRIWGMVSIKHGTILHGVDSARPSGHGPIVHENNRAPYRLDTPRFSTGSIVHESVMQKRLGTGSIVHELVMQKRFGTGSTVHETTIQEWFSTGLIVRESVLQKRFGTGSIVHESVLQKRFGTGSIVHESVIHKRFGTGSIVHESVMQKLFSTSSIVHHYNCSPVMIHFLKTKKHIWSQLKFSWWRINIWFPCVIYIVHCEVRKKWDFIKQFFFIFTVPNRFCITDSCTIEPVLKWWRVQLIRCSVILVHNRSVRDRSCWIDTVQNHAVLDRYHPEYDGPKYQK